MSKAHKGQSTKDMRTQNKEPKYLKLSVLIAAILALLFFLGGFLLALPQGGLSLDLCSRILNLAGALSVAFGGFCVLSDSDDQPSTGKVKFWSWEYRNSVMAGRFVAIGGVLVAVSAALSIYVIN